MTKTKCNATTQHDLSVSTYFFSVTCFSLLISVTRCSRLSQRSRVSLNLAFMLLIWNDFVCRSTCIWQLQQHNNTIRACTVSSYLLGCFLLQASNLILPVNPLRLQLTCQQVRVLQDEDNSWDHLCVGHANTATTTETCGYL